MDSAPDWEDTIIQLSRQPRFTSCVAKIASFCARLTRCVRGKPEVVPRGPKVGIWEVFTAGDERLTDSQTE
jgi:hypothetical protein